MGNTQILIDLAWVLQRTSTLEKIYMLKYGRVIVESFIHIPTIFYIPRSSDIIYLYCPGINSRISCNSLLFAFYSKKFDIQF